MEVRPGYKQTEVGAIPEDWNAAPLGRMIKLQGGYSFQSRDFSDIGVPVIRISDIQGGIVHVEGAICHPPIQLSEDFLVRQGDVVVAMSGATTGKVGLFEHSKPAYQNQRVGKFVVTDKSRTSPGFVEQLVRSSVFVSNLSVFLEQGAQPNISGRQIESLVFAAPTGLAEQEAIAEALSDADALIESLEQLLAKKRQLKQGAMQELLTGKKRLPGFSGEWEVKKLGNIATCFSGGTPPTSVAAYYDGDIPWITSGDLNKGYIQDVQGRISRAGLENSAAKVIESGTLLIALYGATSGVTGISMMRAAINQAVLAIVPHSDHTAFIYFKLRSVKDWLNATYTQGGQPNLSGEIVKSIEVRIPTIEEQTAIAAILSDMDAEIAALDVKLAKARDIKQGMMQELLTGRIRLV